MSKEDWNRTLQNAIERIQSESSRRWKNLDHSMNLEEKLDYNSDEYEYGIVHGLQITIRLLEILKVPELAEKKEAA